MSRPAERNVVSSDGLRYRARATGSLYAETTGRAHADTLKSCFLCGKHMLPEQGKHRKVCGNHTFVCYGCRPELQTGAAAAPSSPGGTRTRGAA